VGDQRSIATRFFGVMDCAPGDVITFPDGIPPFVASTRFVLIADEAKRPLVFLQSLDDASLCFVTAPVKTLDPDYRFTALGEMEGFGPAERLTWLAILTIPESGGTTANLAAPVIIDAAGRRGMQLVRSDGLYSHQEALAAGEASC
jgi:flagellar assembly factor FliW